MSHFSEIEDDVSYQTGASGAGAGAGDDYGIEHVRASDIPNLSPEQLQKLLESTLNPWMDPPDDYSIMMIWALSIISPEGNHSRYDPEVFDKYLANVSKLLHTCAENRIIDPRTDVGTKLISRVKLVREILSRVKSLLYMAHNTKQVAGGLNVCSTGSKEELDFMSQPGPIRLTYEPASGSTLPKNLKIFTDLMNMLSFRNLRKRGNEVFEQVLTKSTDPIPNAPTHTWRLLCTIKEFVFGAYDEFKTHAQWIALHECSKTRRDVIEHLTEVKDERFPELSSSRRYFSFLNGVYDISADRFLDYGSPELTSDIVACRYFRVLMPRQYFEHHNLNPDIIENEAFDQLFRPQGFEPDVVRTIKAIFGLMLHDRGDMDDWHVIPMLLGVAGSGKSTFGNLLSYIYEASDVGVLNNVSEPMYALANLYDKKVSICFEVKHDFSLNQALLQLIAEPKARIPIQEKYKTAREVEWTVPMLLIGNSIPNTLIDVQGALERRFLIIKFTEVPKVRDMSLMNKLKRNIANIIVQCNRYYHRLVDKAGDRDFREVIPPYFDQTIREFRRKTQPFQAMLDESFNSLVLDPERFIMFTDLRDIFNRYLKVKHLRGGRDDEDEHIRILRSNGLKVFDHTLSPVTVEGAARVGKVVYGLGIIETEELITEAMIAYSGYDMESARKSWGELMDVEGDEAGKSSAAAGESIANMML